MSNQQLPEATLIDLKLISHMYPFNRSKLFTLKESYKYPNNCCTFSIEYYDYTNTRDEDNNFIRRFRYTQLTSHMESSVCYAINTYYEKSKLIDYIEFFSSRLTTGIRPVFKYSEIKEYSKIIEEIAPGYLLITFGEYPNSVNNRAKIINANNWQKTKKETGRVYTLVKIDEDEKIIKKYPEVTFDDIEGKFVIKDYEIYEVEPICFLVDLKKDFAISKDIMFCLPLFKTSKSFKGTLPYEFLNTYFVPELMQGIVSEKDKEIDYKGNSIIKELLNSILDLIKNTCIEDIVKEELRKLIIEYNHKLDQEKEIQETLVLDPSTADDIFISKLDALYSKITSFQHYEISKIIISCLYMDIPLNLNSPLYNDLKTLYDYILPSLPEDIRKGYESEILEILLYAKEYIIKLYKKEINEKVNIELIIREKLHPLLESIDKDVKTNFININLNEIIKNIFKASHNTYLADFFSLINELIKEINGLIDNNKLEVYRSKLNQILNIDNNSKSFDYLINLYIQLTKLKWEIEEILKNNEETEQKKIRIKI